MSVLGNISTFWVDHHHWRHTHFWQQLLPSLSSQHTKAAAVACGTSVNVARQVCFMPLIVYYYTMSGIHVKDGWLLAGPVALRQLL
jgi:hypothetical protein|eukprot:COSAG01_NODE_588_length_15134_cov_34.601796_5_plen_86_part_00